MRLRRTLRRLFRLQAPAPPWDPGLATAVARDSTAWRSAVAGARGPRVLIATSVGGFTPATALEGLLAVALTLRGARVSFLLCDSALPACLLATRDGVASPDRFAASGPDPELCPGCTRAGRAAFAPLGLPIHWLSELLTPAATDRARKVAATTPLERIGTWSEDGAEEVGEHALAGALRYFARGELPAGPEGESVLRRYFEASLLTNDALAALFSRERFDCAAFHHGIYTPQGAVGAAARAAGVRVVNWNVAYRRRRFIFSHGHSYHHTLIDEPAEAWEDLELDSGQQADLMSYLASRRHGGGDWIGFHEASEEDPAAIAAALGLDRGRPWIGLLTNVIWDARLHYRANVFHDMLAWVCDTVAWFARNPHLQLVIRAHPGEVRGTLPSRQPIGEELARAFPRLPENVRFIGPERRISTYGVMEQCDTVLIYGTKMGVELAARGIPVVVAGEAWIKNKGVTLDPATSDEYFSILEGLPLRRRLDPATEARARRYAYHFFYRRMIPLDGLAPVPGNPPYRIDVGSLDELRPGASRGLDVVCDGIFEGRPFVYPAELVDTRG